MAISPATAPAPQHSDSDGYIDTNEKETQSQIEHAPVAVSADYEDPNSGKLTKEAILAYIVCCRLSLSLSLPQPLNHKPAWKANDSSILL